jgi:hypothetical protein
MNVFMFYTRAAGGFGNGRAATNDSAVGNASSGRRTTPLSRWTLSQSA